MIIGIEDRRVPEETLEYNGLRMLKVFEGKASKKRFFTKRGY